MHLLDSFSKSMSDGGEMRKYLPRLMHTHAHACAHTLSQKAHRYLRQLQHHRVIHIELSRNRLDEVSATHRDDAEASAECL